MKGLIASEAADGIPVVVLTGGGGLIHASAAARDLLNPAETFATGKPFGLGLLDERGHPLRRRHAPWMRKGTGAPISSVVGVTLPNHRIRWLHVTIPSHPKIGRKRHVVMSFADVTHLQESAIHGAFDTELARIRGSCAARDICPGPACKVCPHLHQTIAALLRCLPPGFEILLLRNWIDTDCSIRTECWTRFTAYGSRRPGRAQSFSWTRDWPHQCEAMNSGRIVQFGTDRTPAPAAFPAAWAKWGYLVPIRADQQWLGTLVVGTRRDTPVWVESRVGQMIATADAIGVALRRSEALQHRLQVHKMETLGAMASGLAHDFNNVLSGIRASVQSVMLELEGHEQLLADLGAIQQETQRAAEMIQHLLLFSRPTPRRVQYVPLNDAVRQMLPMLRWALPHRFTMETQLDPAPLAVRMQRAELEQILLNLVLNARDAMPRGGRIEIRTETRGQHHEVAAVAPDLRPGLHVALTVNDEGTGVAPEVLPRIFDPFFTTKRTGKGSGLGLSVVRSIVAAHGGHVHVENRPSGGASVVLILPARHTKQLPHRAPPRQHVVRGKETILFVDDHAAFNKSFSRLLQQAGFHVFSAADGREALDVYAAHKTEIALVMLDMEMPTISGPNCLVGILAMNPAAKVIMMSGHDAEEIRGPCIERGAKAFISKPFDAASATRLVRKVLDEA